MVSQPARTVYAQQLRAWGGSVTDSQAGLATTAADGLVLKSAAGRWVLLASILGSGLAGIDATVVNVALPAIGRDFGAAFGALQWVITSYTLTLASLILLGGALGDRYGRRRVFIIGVIWFAAASLICGVAPSAGWLIAARALQGIGGALLTPGSLAMIQASFAPADRSRAIGAWSGLGGVATAVGPFVGGWLIQAASWRWVFIINAPLALLVVLIAHRHVPETRDPFASGRVDVLGALLSAAGLAGITYAIIAAPEVGISSPAVLISGGLGVLAMAGFLFAESRIRFPMLPLSMFKVRQFSAANAVTFAVYAGFGGVFFLLAVQLQVIGFSPIAAGTALLPITVVMLLLSARFGALAARIGPRIPMTVGPLICAAGTLLMLRIGPGATYLVDVLPAVLVLGFGLSLLVAPLTATVLASVGAEHAGVASGVNNAVARAAALIAVAALPAVSGLSGASYDDPSAFTDGFRMALLIAVGLLIIGAGIAAATIRANPLSVSPAVPPQPQPTAEALVPARAAELQPTSNRLHCAVDGPPLCPESRV
jgi:EmrB/QacA subfamily drug resistance transporter